MTETTLDHEGRLSRLEGIVEQINQRLDQMQQQMNQLQQFRWLMGFQFTLCWPSGRSSCRNYPDRGMRPSTPGERIKTAW